MACPGPACDPPADPQAAAPVATSAPAPARAAARIPDRISNASLDNGHFRDTDYPGSGSLSGWRSFRVILAHGSPSACHPAIHRLRHLRVGQAVARPLAGPRVLTGEQSQLDEPLESVGGKRLQTTSGRNPVLRQVANDLSGLDQTVVAGFSTHPHWDHLLWHARLGAAPRYGTARGADVIRDGCRTRMEGPHRRADTAGHSRAGTAGPARPHHAGMPPTPYDRRQREHLGASVSVA